MGLLLELNCRKQSKTMSIAIEVPTSMLLFFIHCVGYAFSYNSGHLEVDFMGIEYNYTYPLSLTVFHA